MKNRLNITVDDSLVDRAKQYAAQHHTSLSQLVEDYFRELTRLPQRKNVRDLLKELPRPDLSDGTAIKSHYYESRKKKYGF